MSQNTIWKRLDDAGNPLEVGKHYALYDPENPMSCEPQLGALAKYDYFDGMPWFLDEMGEPHPDTYMFKYARKQL